MPPTSAAGDSVEQRSVEPEMLAALAARLGISLNAKAYPVGPSRVEIDGVSESPLVLCEACAHQGAPKPAQKNKIIADAFKMVYAERVIGRPARKIVLLADERAAAPFRGRGWASTAFKALGIEVAVVELTAEWRERLRQAQIRQYR